MKRLVVLGLLFALAGASPALGAGLILNEFNSVSAGKVLAGGDTTFGTKAGNGGNWVELVVTTDHLNIQGWKLEWTNSDPDSGNLIFTNNALWSDLRSGTIITVREDDTGDPGPPVGARPTDVSFNPAGNDWWIEINADDALYIIKNNFKVDNDDWQGRILDASSTVQQGYVGESIGGLPWSGSGISSTEVGALLANPTAVNPASGYFDVTYSSYGAPNKISTGVFQDFSALRAAVPEPSSILLAMLGTCGTALVAWRRRRR